MQSFYQIIQRIRTTSVNAKHAGTRFEVLSLRWLLATQLNEVKRGWIWSDFAKVVGKEGRSPLGWIIDQYQVSIDKDSGIKNDPNDWCGEHNNPRYILELILRVIEVSVRPVRIVKGLPKVEV